jgi:hypothetical protein
MGYLALGGLGFLVVFLFARWFAAAKPADLAQAGRTFVAVFSVLASTGLLFAGRFGLAIVTIAATFMAIRALVRGHRTADPIPGDGAAGPSSSVTTDLLEMCLDHATGELEGRVRRGAAAGRELGELGLSHLLALLDEARREDPPSVALLETYLDRRWPDWRAGSEPGASAEAMDERTALHILGLEDGASVEAIRAAHRRLMARLHPDHGGSDWIASQINRARDLLLGGGR